MTNPRTLAALLAAAAVAAAVGPNAPAQTAPAPRSVEERITALEQEINALKQQLAQETVRATEKEKSIPMVTAGAEGFTLKSADGNFALQLHGIVQGDGRFYLEDHAKSFTDTFLVRRARPILQATVFHDFDLRLVPDFGGGSAVIQDAWLDWHHWAWLQLRIGKFKEPVGLERLQEDAYTLFIEPAFPTSLVPNRDVGAQASGTLLGGVVSYAAGVFNGVPDGANGDLDNNDSKDAAARLFVQPFKRTELKALQGLGVGIAGTYGDQDGSAGLPTYKTSGQQTFFKYLSGSTTAATVVANGNRARLAPQAYYYWGPLGLIGEYTVSEQTVALGKTTDTLRNHAWQIAGSVVLTGDHASYKGVNPSRPFDLNKGQWGALELVARYNEFHADHDAFPKFADPSKSASAAHAWGVGLNWYLNKDLKLALDFEQTSFDGGAGSTSAPTDRTTEEVIFTRAQLIF